MEIKDLLKRVWAEIDLSAIEKNYNLIKERVDNNTKICCVVKANAYGHGAVVLAKFYEHLGVNLFAVSNVEEALQLRKAGINSDILILGYTDECCVKLLIDNNFIQCVYSYEYAKLLSEQAKAIGKRITVHIKIDSGMGRIGFRCLNQGMENDLEQAYQVCVMPEFNVQGIFTHFSVADEGENGAQYTNEQYKNFEYAIKTLENKGVSFAVKHCSNSGAICDYKDYQMNVVRAGIALYGIEPSQEIQNKLPLIPAMTLKTVVSHVKTINAGDSVNYGRIFVAKKQMKVATLPLGYADGYFRSNTGKSQLLIHGKKADIIGRVCMDQLVVDVTDIDNVKIGDEVVVFGSEPAMTAQEIAKLNGTIPYEVVCSVGMRVPRIYLYNGKTVYLQDYLI